MGLEPEKISSYVLTEQQQEKVNDIYKKYLEEIVPLLSNLEVVDSEYPVEITNEIRAIFTHLSRCFAFPTKVDIDAQIKAAERHVKRALLDCYKYTCLSHADSIKAFRNDYHNIDLTLVDSGEFIKTLSKKTVSAQEKINNAKRADTYNVVIDDDFDIKTTDKLFESYCKSICDDDLFSMYQEAYKEYSECVELINKNYDAIDYLVQKSARIDNTNRWGLIVGIIGAIFGAVGIAIGIISFIMK